MTITSQTADPGDKRTIQVLLRGGAPFRIEEGTTLLSLSRHYDKNFRYAIVAAKVDNELRELSFQLEKDCNIEFMDIGTDDGMRIYRRSLCFILIKAVHDLFPEKRVIISHTISNGLYCEVTGGEPLRLEDIDKISERMRELVRAEIPFIKELIPLEEAEEFLGMRGRLDRFHAAEHRDRDTVTLYSCDGLLDYFYGYMAPHTGYIKTFDLKNHTNGLLLLIPEKSDPLTLPQFFEQKKLFNIILEYKHWIKVLGAANVGDLNDAIKAGGLTDFIRVSEAFHEKKIAQIADSITAKNDKVRVVLISGPSSSGKTTFAHRLAIQLRVNGIRPVNISLDDYFVERSMTPRDENNEHDYEALEALDLPLFNQQLSALIAGEAVDVPTFDFTKGARADISRRLQIAKDQIIIIEGIHGLNERLTSAIPKECKYKIYVSALTSMNIDDHNRIPSTDTRLIRRIVRDYQYRDNSAASTIKRWPSVRAGEIKNIFPFQEEADVMFNSFTIYELGALKPLAEKVLAEIEKSEPEYSEVKRLREFLSYFLPIFTKEIPLNSIVREFLGGSCFY